MTAPALRWVDDPGHGWLVVPSSLVVAAGVEPSVFSYISPDGLTIYLEEDSDAFQFVTACGYDPEQVAALPSHEDLSVRGLPSYDRSLIPTGAGAGEGAAS